VLHQLVETAFRNNPSLQAAGVGILGARAQLNKSIGNGFPQKQGMASQVNYSWLNSRNPAGAAGTETIPPCRGLQYRQPPPSG
jgi:outer membrane protein TolC